MFWTKPPMDISRDYMPSARFVKPNGATLQQDYTTIRHTAKITPPKITPQITPR